MAWDGQFYLLGADYFFDRDRNETAFRVQGVTREHATFVGTYRGHNPNFYVKLPKGCLAGDLEDFLNHWEFAARKNLYTYMSSTTTPWIREELEQSSEWIRAIDSVVGREFLEYQLEDTCTFYRVEVAHPSLVRMFRDYVEHPFGGAKYASVPDWCPLAYENIATNLLLGEADVDYVHRIMFDRQYKPCEWYKTEGDYKVATRLIPDFDRTPTRHNVVLNADIECLRPVGDIRPPSLRIFAYDIEAENEAGREFPDPEKHRVLQIGCVVYRDGKAEDAVAHLFALRSLDAPDNCDHLRCFEDEATLLSAWRTFFMTSGCDVMVGHNSNGFDLRYLIARAGKLGLRGFANLGMCKGNANIKPAVNKGFTKWNASMKGGYPLCLDTMRAEMESYQALDVGLNALSAKYLKKMSKVDVHPDQITVLQMTRKGRKRLGFYCMMDVVLVMKIEQKQRLALSTLGIANNSVPPQTILNRSTGIRSEGAIGRACFEGEVPIISIMRSFQKRKNVGRTPFCIKDDYSGPKSYQGAVNLDPKGGYWYPRANVILNPVVIVLDFKALYPSIIRRFNTCHSTLIHPDVIRALNFEEGVDYWSCPDVVDAPDGAKITPNPMNPCYVSRKRRVGVLPGLQDFLATKRSEKKREMAVIRKRLETEELTEEERIELSTDHAVADQRQLNVKLTANSMYGYTGAQVSRGFCPEVATTITRMGRVVLYQTRDYIRERCEGCEVIYGDTDSVMVLMHLASFQDAIQIGHRMAKEITEFLDLMPVELEFEKALPVYFQEKKKNYGGIMYEVSPEGTFHKPNPISMGFSWKKRKCPRYFRTSCEGISGILISEDPHLDRLGECQKLMRDAEQHIVDHDVSLSGLFASQKLGKRIGDYGEMKEVKNKSTGMVKMQKGTIPAVPAILKREHAELVRKRKRDYDESIKRTHDSLAGKRKRDAGTLDEFKARFKLVPPPEPSVGTNTKWIVAKRPDAASSKIGDRGMTVLNAAEQGVEYDESYYVDSYEKTVASSFGRPLAVLMGKEKEVLALPKKPPAKRDTFFKKLVRGAIGNISSRRAPPARAITSAFARFVRVPTCPKCKQIKANCACDLTRVLEETREDLNRTRREEAESWAICAECIDDDDQEEARKCISVGCKNWGERLLLGTKVREREKKLRDIEDLGRGETSSQK